MTIRLTSISILIIAGAAALAQKQEPPVPGEPRAFTLPARTNITLDNGLVLTMVPYGSVPKAAVSVAVRVGNVNEGPGEVWLADLTGDMMKEGTTSRTAKQLADDAAGMGGSLDVSVFDDYTTVGGAVLSEFTAGFVALLADVVRNPSFPATELPRVKNDRLRELSISRTQPQSLALEKFRAVLYGDHPYGRVFPTEEMVTSFTLDMVKGFHRSGFGPSRTHVYVCGMFDAGKVEQAVRQVFGDWAGTDAPAVPTAEPRSARAAYIVDRPGAPQSTLYLGLPVPDPSDPEYRAFSVMNALLGGSFSSRITSNIRENKGYTYSPYSTVSPRYRSAYWIEVADVSTNVTGAALREIFFEIDRVRKEPPPGQELKAIQNYLAGVFVVQNSSLSGIINQLTFLDQHGLPASYLTDAVKNIHAVTPEKVQELAARYLKDEAFTLVVVGDSREVTSQLRTLIPVAR